MPFLVLSFRDISEKKGEGVGLCVNEEFYFFPYIGFNFFDKSVYFKLLHERNMYLGKSGQTITAFTQMVASCEDL